MWRTCILGAAALIWVGAAGAVDLGAAWEMLRAGEYEQALERADEGRKAEPREEDWWRIQIEALMALGRYAEAADLVQSALRTSLRDSLRLRLIGVPVALLAGEPTEAERFKRELNFLVRSRQISAREVQRVVEVGEAALLLGHEPRLILENFLKRGRESKPPVRDAFLAIGRLALAKSDYALASRTFQQGIALFGDADMWAGLAASFIDGDRTRLVEYAEKALELNERHAGARLLLAENKIDSEEFDRAEQEIERVLAVNPRSPEAHALRAVIAQLRGDFAAAQAAREQALDSWTNNPEVDYLIGRKLAQRQLHGEAVVALRRSLAFDPGYTPARIQLAQALLRSGREDEGWNLAQDVHDDDAYDITAYNLVNLRDRLTEYTTLSTPHFELRMAPEEAPIYGDRALALLERAREKLTAKYGVTLSQKTAVEIFANPKDFSVRTFGMPGGPPAFLGVCFGPLVTVNSPASKPANWEATLWHEFTHSITLELTHHRIPRWLTEGISVFEEVQENPAWGQQMGVSYYLRIVDGRIQPISRMSAAFLEAEQLEDVVFAYYQSYLVVQFLVDHYGFDQLRALLAALGAGAEINAALAQHFAPLEELDDGFKRFARARADAVAGSLNLRPPDSPLGNTLGMVDRRSLFGQLAKARELMQNGRALEARFVLKGLATEGFYLPGRENVHQQLAAVCRELGDTVGERDALAVIVNHESDAVDAVARLVELAEAEKDFPAVALWADRWLAINPLAPTPWRALFTAHEQQGNAAAAASAGATLLKLDPPDRASVHYRIARLLEQTDAAQSRDHVLRALEEAPRFRAAHALLEKLPPGRGVEVAPLEPRPVHRAPEEEVAR